MKEGSQKYCLRLKIKETNIENEEVAVVDKFIFLWLKIEKGAGCAGKIQLQIVLGRATMNKAKKVMKDRDILTKTKIKIVKAIPRVPRDDIWI